MRKAAGVNEASTFTDALIGRIAVTGNQAASFS
jgi:hypothetical protein